MVFFKKSPKRLIEESIMLAVDALTNEIQTTLDDERAALNANSVRVLAEAFDIVHRGKVGEF